MNNPVTVRPTASELLPCPFCGGNPITFSDPIYGPCIACEKPRCGGHEIRLAPNKWNARAQPQPKRSAKVQKALDSIRDVVCESNYGWAPGKLDAVEDHIAALEASQGGGGQPTDEVGLDESSKWWQSEPVSLAHPVQATQGSQPGESPLMREQPCFVALRNLYYLTNGRDYYPGNITPMGVYNALGDRIAEMTTNDGWAAFVKSIHSPTITPHAELDGVQATQAGGRPVVLKGIGKITGDGWKDTTTIGEVVFVWNTELPPPYAPGQYPRIGYTSYSASTEQYDFSPATMEEANEWIEKRVIEARAPAPSAQALREALELCMYKASSYIATIPKRSQYSRMIDGALEYIVQTARAALTPSTQQQKGGE